MRTRFKQIFQESIDKDAIKYHINKISQYKAAKEVHDSEGNIKFSDLADNVIQSPELAKNAHMREDENAYMYSLAAKNASRHYNQEAGKR